MRLCVLRNLLIWVEQFCSMGLIMKHGQLKKRTALSCEPGIADCRTAEKNTEASLMQLVQS
jgi:hypothetical protein